MTSGPNQTPCASYGCLAGLGDAAPLVFLGLASENPSYRDLLSDGSASGSVLALFREAACELGEVRAIARAAT